VNARRRLNTLIADDDPSLRSDLQAQLKALGHEVIAMARDGREAVALARRLRPDVILMDASMPGMGGIEASRTLDPDRLCPVILLTTRDDRHLARQAQILTILSYLVKPFSQRALEAAIAVAMDGFRHLIDLERDAAELGAILQARAALNQAVQRLARSRAWSSDQALDWIQQEARAKKAGLVEVAEAVLRGKSVNYHYDVPI